MLRTKQNDDGSFIQKNRQVLWDYINSLYGAPTYDGDNTQLLSEAYNTFKNKEDDTTPECIWITPKSRIALIKKFDEATNYLKYEIFAEPVK